jgi:hypothetical protein
MSKTNEWTLLKHRFEALVDDESVGADSIEEITPASTLFAASAADSPPVETMISTGRCASSSAISGSRSCWPSAQRYSIGGFLFGVVRL